VWEKVGAEVLAVAEHRGPLGSEFHVDSECEPLLGGDQRGRGVRCGGVTQVVAGLTRRVPRGEASVSQLPALAVASVG
jgi:hypothetical protein